MFERIKNFIKEIEEEEKQKEAEEKLKKEQQEQLLKRIEQGELTPIDSPGIMCKKGEYCYIHCNATRAIIRTKKQYNSSGGGVSYRLCKGVTLHSGGAKTAPVEYNVQEIYPGDLFITNRRIIFINDLKPCTVTFSSIDVIQKFNNAIVLFKNTTRYAFILGDNTNFVKANINGILKKYYE